MKILDRYIGKQVFVASLFAILIIIVILVLGNVFQEILRELAKRPDLSLAFVLRFILLVIPISLSLAVPFSFLTAILLVFGRLSADSEFVSMRMAGLSMWRICLPIAWISLFFTGLCGWINASVTPAAKMEMEGMKDTLINYIKRDPMLIFPDGKVMKDLPGHLVWAEKKEGKLKKFQMVKMKNDEPEALAIAQSSEVSVDLDGEEPQLLMRLSHVNLMVKGEDGSFMESAQPIFMKDADTGFSLAKYKGKGDEVKDQPENLGLKSLLSKLRDRAVSPEMRSEYRTELSTRFAFSVSCIAFALVGIPLGITAQRRESTMGFIYSLCIAVTYYVLLITAQMMKQKEEMYPHLLVWIPNVLIIALGLVMFWRLSRK